MANDFRVENSKNSRNNLISLVLVSDQQITVGTVAAGLIQKQWLLWVDMDEQRQFSLPGLIGALRTCTKPRILIRIEKEAVTRRLLAKPWCVLLVLLPHCSLALL